MLESPELDESELAHLYTHFVKELAKIDSSLADRFALLMHIMEPRKERSARLTVFTDSDSVFELLRHGKALIALAASMTPTEYGPIVTEVAVMHTRDIIRMELTPGSRHDVTQDQIARAHVRTGELLRGGSETAQGERVPLIEVDGFRLTPIEVPVYQALKDRRLLFTPQAWIVSEGRPRYRVDFLIYYDGRPTALEVDGHEWHKSREQRRYDAARDRFLHARGIQTIRFTGSEIHRDLQGSMFELMDCLTRDKSREI